MSIHADQNGVAKRINRTIIERVRFILIDSELDQNFWAGAASTASYFINRVLCRGNERYPEELPNFKHLRVLEWPTLVHVQKQWSFGACTKKKNGKIESMSWLDT